MRILYLVVVACLFGYFVVLFHSDNEAVDVIEVVERNTVVTEKKPGTAIRQSRDLNNVRVIEQIRPELENNKVIQGEATGRLYKWKSNENITVISMEAPPEGVVATTILYSNEPTMTDSPQNLIKRVPGQKTKDVVSFRDDPLRVYTPEGLKEFIDYSKEIGEKIEVRGEELEELVKML